MHHSVWHWISPGMTLEAPSTADYSQHCGLRSCSESLANLQRALLVGPITWELPHQIKNKEKFIFGKKVGHSWWYRLGAKFVLGDCFWQCWWCWGSNICCLHAQPTESSIWLLSDKILAWLRWFITIQYLPTGPASFSAIVWKLPEMTFKFPTWQVLE